VSQRFRAEAALVAVTVIWGSTFLLIKQALANVSPLLFLLLRFSLATAALAALLGPRAFRPAARAEAKHPVRAELAAGALCGTFLFAGYLLQTLGLALTSPAKSAFLTGLASVMVPFLGAAVYRNRPQVSEVVGVAMATGGLALMTLNGPAGTVNPGDLLTLLCAAGFAAHIVTLGHFSERMRFEVLSIAQAGAAAAWSAGLLWFFEMPRIVWRPEVAAAVLVGGLLATALAFTVQAWAMQYTSSTRTAVIFMLEPVVAWAASFWLAGEGLSARAAAGAALILLGIVTVELKPLRQRKHP
jgi:drug/metabolite transporter (DMT)-like permease